MAVDREEVDADCDDYEGDDDRHQDCYQVCHASIPSVIIIYKIQIRFAGAEPIQLGIDRSNRYC